MKKRHMYERLFCNLVQGTWAEYLTKKELRGIWYKYKTRQYKKTLPGVFDKDNNWRVHPEYRDLSYEYSKKLKGKLGRMELPKFSDIKEVYKNLYRQGRFDFIKKELND